MANTFGTLLVDPPWNYQATSRAAKLSGYSDVEYRPLTTQELCTLPVGDLARDDSVLVLWTVFPMLRDAVKVLDSWGFDYVTGLPWVKVSRPGSWNLHYGVGFWFRGCAELVLIGKRKRAYRTNLVGLLSDNPEGTLVSENFGHSRKPDHIYDLIERGGFPGSYLELFARRNRKGWVQAGNELPGFEGEDIREALERIKRANPWELRTWEETAEDTWEQPVLADEGMEENSFRRTFLEVVPRKFAQSLLSKYGESDVRAALQDYFQYPEIQEDILDMLKERANGAAEKPENGTE